jgi:hypothetical protein
VRRLVRVRHNREPERTLLARLRRPGGGVTRHTVGARNPSLLCIAIEPNAGYVTAVKSRAQVMLDRFKLPDIACVRSMKDMAIRA